jgi:hypothetical protein
MKSMFTHFDLRLYAQTCTYLFPPNLCVSANARVLRLQEQGAVELELVVLQIVETFSS